MRIKRAYLVGKLDISPKQILENDIYPKYIGMVNGLPVLEVDFVDNKVNRKILLNASVVSKFPRSFNSFAEFVRKAATGKDLARFVDIQYDGSPIADISFLYDLLYCGTKRLEDYARERRFEELFMGAEMIKKILGYISTHQEIGKANPIYSLTPPHIYEFNPKEVAENFSNDMAENIDFEFQRSQNPAMDFKPTKYSSVEKVAAIARKYFETYPFLYTIIAGFINKYGSIFLKNGDPISAPKNLYFTKAGSITKLAGVEEREDSVILKYKIDKEATYNEILKEISEIVKRAYIRYISNIEPDLKRGKCNYCIVSKSGKPVVCYPTYKEASEHLDNKINNLLNRKKPYYVVSYGHTPILVTASYEEALTAHTRSLNFANYLKYLTIYSSLHDVDTEELGSAVKQGAFLFLANSIINLTNIDEKAASFSSFSEEVEELLTRYNISGRASFIVTVPMDTTSGSTQENVAFRQSIYDALSKFNIIGSGSSPYLTYIRSFDFSGTGNPNFEEFQSELRKIIEKYHVDEEGMFPPPVFSFTIRIEEPENLTITRREDLNEEGK